jgi:acyl-CoA thioesterase
MSADHPFDAAIKLSAVGEGVFDGATHAGYANMVGPFGGITASTLLHAAWLHPQRLGEPLALTVNFAGPVVEGPFRVTARALRTNRSTQHWHIELEQGGELAASASAVFGQRRDTWSATEIAPPLHGPGEQVPVKGLSPRVVWPQRYEMQFVKGGWPDFANPQDAPADSDSELWIRDSPPRPLDALALAAICDAFYPRIFRRRQRFTPAGTVTLSTYFHADAALLAAQGTRAVLGRARAQHFGGGYFDQTAEIWGDGGRLLAVSHQLVYFKD